MPSMFKKHRTKGVVTVKKQKLDKEIRKVFNKELKKRVESKMFSTSTDVRLVAMSNPILSNVSDIAQGNLDNERIGDEVYIKWARLRVRIFHNIGGEAGSVAPILDWKIRVFQYKNDTVIGNPLQAQMDLSSISNYGGINDFCPFSPRNIDHLNNYHMLYEKLLTTCATLDHNSTSVDVNFGGNAQSTHLIDVKIPLKKAKRKLQFDAGGEDGTNSLWVMIMNSQNSGVPNTNWGGAYFTFDLGYTDM